MYPRVWMRRAELNALLTRELRKIPGCQDASLKAGAALEVTDFTRCNWEAYEVVPGPSSDPTLVTAVGGGVVSQMKERYNVVD